MKKWECTVCSYVHEGDTPPDKCPVCGADSSAFEEVVDKVASSETETRATAEAAEIVSEASKVEAPKDAELPPSSTVAPSIRPTLFSRVTALIVKHHLHPIAVHSPNGIMPMALVFLLIAALLGFPSFDTAALYSLVFVFISLPMVIFTGYIAWKNRYRGALTFVFKIKIACSALLLLSLAVLICWRAFNAQVVLSPDSRWPYLFIALVALAAAAVAGHLGGKLIMASRK